MYFKIKMILRSFAELTRRVASIIIQVVKQMKAARSTVPMIVDIEQMKQVPCIKRMSINVINQMNALLLRFTTLALVIVTVSTPILLPALTCYAGKFSSSYPCYDNGKRCVSSGARTVDGYVVHRDCWQWSYSKTCNYPSKNNCSQYTHCYLVAFRECLLSDSIGNCVNQLKEYSCKRWAPNFIPVEKVRYGREEKQGINNLRCKGLPCVDGNCVDKSYDSNNEMMDSVSKLYAVSQMKGVVNILMELFAGYSASCSKKAVGYSNCCKLDSGANNWGHNIVTLPL